MLKDKICIVGFCRICDPLLLESLSYSKTSDQDAQNGGGRMQMSKFQECLRNNLFLSALDVTAELRQSFTSIILHTSFLSNCACMMFVKYGYIITTELLWGRVSCQTSAGSSIYSCFHSSTIHCLHKSTLGTISISRSHLQQLKMTNPSVALMEIQAVQRTYEKPTSLMLTLNAVSEENIEVIENEKIIGTVLDTNTVKHIDSDTVRHWNVKIETELIIQRKL